MRDISSKATETPTVSLILIAYNQENFIKAACESVIYQKCAPIEIILSDDASTDRTFTIMQSIVEKYKGIHKIQLNRNKSNLGLIEHINHVMGLSTGSIIIYAAGDDISEPNRVQTTLNYFQNQSTLIAHSDIQEFNDHNHYLQCSPPLTNQNMPLIKMARKYALIIGATCAWRRELFYHFGPIKYRDAYEDLIMVFRAHLLGGQKSIAYINVPLVKYRVDSGGISQGGRKKPKGRKNRQDFELKRLLTQTAVCHQRLVDSYLMDSVDAIYCLENELICLKTMKLTIEKKTSLSKLLKYAIRNNSAAALAKALILRIRGAI